MEFLKRFSIIIENLMCDSHLFDYITSPKFHPKYSAIFVAFEILYKAPSIDCNIRGRCSIKLLQ